ncbi:MAG: restriction endonuclease subunit S [Nostoc sp.]
MTRQLVSLSNHCDFLAGYSFKSSRFSRSPEDVPLVKGENLGHREIDWIKAVRWPASEAKDFEKFELNPGDVVLAMDRPIVQGRLKFSWIRNHEPRALLVQRVARLRGYNGLETDFLRYLVASPAFQAHIETITTGVNVPHISGKDILSYSFPLPTLSTQQRIAEILSNYDRFIDNNNRRIALLEESIHLLYKEWFVRSRFPGYESVKLVDGIPEGWNCINFSEALILQRGFDLPNKDRKPGEIPIYASTGINGFHDTAKVKAPGVVTGRSGSLGSVMYVQKDFWPLNTTLWVKEFKKVTPPFAYCLLSQMDLNSYQAGAAVPTLNRNVIHGVKILVPCEELQSKFDNFANSILIQIEVLKKYNYNLRQARDLLLPRLMNGSIAV